MAYFLNTNIKDNKKVKIALCDIYGINITLSKKICDKRGISEHVKFNQLSQAKIEEISQLINENGNFGPELKQLLYKQKARLMKISCYRGFRYKQGLPCRGQRTHTNANIARTLKLKVN